MLEQAATAEILSSRALGYRKIVLGLGATILAIGFMDSAIKYDELSFFGLRVSDRSNSKVLVLRVLFGLFAYHAMMFAYYSWRDFYGWKGSVTEHKDHDYAHYEDGPIATVPYYPELPMFLRSPPSNSAMVRYSRGKEVEASAWKRSLHNGSRHWEVVIPEGTKSRTIRFVASDRLYRGVRSRLLWFALNDIAVPGVLLAAVLMQYFVGWHIV